MKSFFDGHGICSDALKASGKKRYVLLSCEIIYREACLLAAESENIVDVNFLPKGLHDMGQEKMSERLQEHITDLDEKGYDAILLGYGRCNNGVAGLTTKKTPLVIPRAHDCITFFFGSQQAYNDYFNSHPGTYFRTTGWSERGDYEDMESQTVMSKLGLDKTYEEYVEMYGQDNAKFIMESMGGWQEKYERITYIRMGLPSDKEYEDLAQQEAQKRNWSFESVDGDLNLLRRLISGNWSVEDFLVVAPGQTIIADDSGKILSICNFS